MSSTHADRGIEDVTPGSVCAWLCTSATVEGLARGRACWDVDQIGNRSTRSTGVRKTIAIGTIGGRYKADEMSLEGSPPVRRLKGLLATGLHKVLRWVLGG